MRARQEADFVSLGRGALTHADWPLRLRAGQAHEAFDLGLLAPIADLANAARHRTARAEAKPRSLFQKSPPSTKKLAMSMTSPSSCSCHRLGLSPGQIWSM
ncbi:hypothetical protein G6F32_016809 [Rhizopus arrhizus]|nr:hypothetical protein G6F32_016809 [Rhizopus arrhizus]